MANQRQIDREGKTTRRKRKPSEPAHWTDAPAWVIGAFIHAIVSDGRAVLMGTTSDGGALVCRVYDDGEADSNYIKPRDDVHEILSDILEDYGCDRLAPLTP